MKSIKQQYIDLREGNMTQANFMRNLRMTMPQYITNITSFNDSIRILKNKGILTEADTKGEDKISKYEKYTYTLNGKVVYPEIAFYNNILKAEVDGEIYNIGQPIDDKIELSSIKGKTGMYTEALDPTAAEEIAKLAKSYKAAVDKLMDMGLTSQEADKIANEIYPEEEYIEDDDTYNDLKADDYRMNQVNENTTDLDLEKLEDELDKLEDKVDAKQKATIVSIIKNILRKGASKLNTSVPQGTNPGKDPFDLGYDTTGGTFESLKESKDSSSEGKWKTVTGKDLYGHFKEIDNLNAQEVLIGIDYEREKNPELTKSAAAKIVVKNLKKNPIYYTSTLMSGIEGYEPEYIGGKSANPEAHQMQYLDKNMGNVVDKKRGMQPVKGIEKAKKDSDKGGETNKAVKGIELMSLIAKTVRGMKKMDATGEKMKKIIMKEGMEGQYTFNGYFKDDELDKLMTMIPDAEIDDQVEYGQGTKTTIFSQQYSDEEIRKAVNSVIGMPGTKKDVPGTVFNRNAGITSGLKSLTKDDLMEMIREELREITGAYGGDDMGAEDGSSYVNKEQY